MRLLAGKRVIEIVTTNDEGRWLEILERTGRYDFYHLPTYHRLAELSGEGEAVLFSYEDDGYSIAMPLLLRAIDGEEMSGWRDVTSVYGYAGPVISHREMPATVLQRFTTCLQEFFQQRQIVCAFSRLHPLLPGGGALSGYGETLEYGVTISIDLQPSESEQKSAYRKTTRYDINRLLRMGAEFREEGEEQLDAFLDLYYGTMQRVHAAPYYFFSRDYFRNIFREMPGVAHLFVCRVEEVPISAGLFMQCNGIVQYHLSGSHPDYMKFAPSRLLIDTARQWATGIGAHTLHLGGGVGGQRDSLYDFKHGFSRREHSYALWRCIVDSEAYRALYQSRCRRTGIQPDGTYFPAYRHPAFESVECLPAAA